MNKNAIHSRFDSAILGGNGRHIEISIHHNEDATCTLIAQSGTAGNRPDRQKAQGPYESAEHALAARRAIIHALTTRGFYPVISAIPRWSIDAQREIRRIREQRMASTVNYQFDPEELFPR